MIASSARTLAEEDVDGIFLVHRLGEPGDLGFEVDVHLRHPHRIDIPAVLAEEELGTEIPRIQALAVSRGGGAGKPAAVAPHHLMDDEVAAAGRVLIGDVLEEDRALFGGGPGTEGLADREDVVVDRLRQSDHRELVAVLVQVGRKIGGGGVGVVAADRVEDVDLVAS